MKYSSICFIKIRGFVVYSVFTCANGSLYLKISSKVRHLYKWKNTFTKKKIPQKFEAFYNKELGVTERYFQPQGKCKLTVHDVGRLGNQMFEYVTLWMIAKTFKGLACISEVRL